MKDTELYSRILGLTESWFVETVELTTADGRVDMAWVNKSGLAPAQGGRADPAAPGEHPDLLSPPDHKRRGRGAEQQDHGHQTESLRLQESGPLQDRHLLLLWRSGLLSSQLVGGVTHGKPGRAKF